MKTYKLYLLKQKSPFYIFAMLIIGRQKLNNFKLDANDGKNAIIYRLKIFCKKQFNPTITSL